MYVNSGPPYLILLHPALGPIWEVTRQKVLNSCQQFCYATRTLQLLAKCHALSRTSFCFPMALLFFLFASLSVVPQPRVLSCKSRLLNLFGEMFRQHACSNIIDASLVYSSPDVSHLMQLGVSIRGSDRVFSKN